MSFVRSLNALLMISCNFHVIGGMSASPKPFRERQPTGDMTPHLFIRGDSKFHYITDSNGFTVIQNENKTYVYAVIDESGSTLVPTNITLGETNHIDATANKLPNFTMRTSTCGRLCESNEEPTTSLLSSDVIAEQLGTGGVVARKNLVILIRFADHVSRMLPFASDFNELFNNISPGSPLVPAGGVRHYYRSNSYGSLDLQSVVHGWVDLPETEAYYADGQSGLSDAFPRALFHALDAIDADDFPWGDLDMNGDGIIDSLTLIHSGYAAEWGQTDSGGQPMSNRIWSHHWTIPRSRRWKSSTGHLVDKYIACSGLWDTKGSQISRLGVIVHELGHSLGLPDLYGSGNMLEDSGIGSYGVMGNAWGVDGSQNYPPHLCPWSKMVLGWSRPLLITQGGNYDIRMSATNDNIYRIDLGKSEYLLIENRQPFAFDEKLPGGGLAIWHIDEAASNLAPGFPGQNGWPMNGYHYQVALLQADGMYDLEQAINTGDAGDLFHANGRATIGPSTKGAKYPNTDAYQGGIIKSSGVTIENISPSSPTMKFSVAFGEKVVPSPTLSPTISPTKTLQAGFQAGTGGAGNMFDLVSKKDLVLTVIEVHTYATAFIQIEIWSKIGTFQGHENERTNWELIKSVQVHGKGIGKGTPIPIPNLEMRVGQVRSFYITASSGGSLAFTKGQSVGTVYASNNDMEIMEGVSKAYPFGATFPNRRWNGSLKYQVGKLPTSSPIPMPTSLPQDNSQAPTIAPRIRQESLTTTWQGGSAQDGNMFDVMPLKNIIITGFDLHVSFKEEVIIEVYTKRDSFRGHESVCSEWTMAARVVLMGKGKGSITSLPEHSFNPIPCEPFRVRSFYITIVSSKPGGITYSKGDGSGSPTAKDDNLMVFEGVGNRYPCLSAFPGRTWNGAIHYTVVDQPMEIMTTFLGGNQAAGNMFDIVANKALEIVGLEVHIASKRELLLQLFVKSGSYIGYESRRDSWSRVANVTIVGQGFGERTIVPENAFEPIHIEDHGTVALYVTVSEPEMRYSRHWADKQAASNDDMIITKGLGRGFLFGASYSDRVWNGVLKYNLD